MDEIIFMLLGGSVAFLLATLFISLALWVFLLVCQWRIFVKLGQKGWASIIPFYNTFVLTNAVWELIPAILATFLQVGLCVSIFLTGNIPLIGVLAFLFLIAFFIVSVIMTHKMCTWFGHGIGFTIGCLFLPIIFYAIMAFSD